jgi:hypothetical protein
MVHELQPPHARKDVSTFLQTRAPVTLKMPGVKKQRNAETGSRKNEQE